MCRASSDEGALTEARKVPELPFQKVDSFIKSDAFIGGADTAASVRSIGHVSIEATNSPNAEGTTRSNPMRTLNNVTFGDDEALAQPSSTATHRKTKARSIC